MSDAMMRCHLCTGWSGGCTGACRVPYTPQAPYQPGFAEVAPKGCICPPTAEQTCQRWDCGRKGITTGTTTTSGVLADAKSKTSPHQKDT